MPGGKDKARVMKRDRSTYPWFALVCALGAVPACLDDKSLGDDDGSTSTTHASTTSGTGSGSTVDPSESTGTSQANTDNPSGPTGTSETNTDDPSGSTETSDADTGTTDQADSSDGSASTSDPAPQLCDAMVPPALACEPRGDASFVVEGDALPPGTDQPCTVVAAEPRDEFTHFAALACEDIEYELTLSSTVSNLFLYVLEVDSTISVTAAEAESPAISGLPSFVLRRPDTGAILLAQIDAVGHSRDPEVDVDLSPLVVTALESGCEYRDVSEGCDDGSILAHRVSLSIEGPEGVISLFDGHYGDLPDGSHGMAVIVNRAQRITCWDENCTGDDSGPFDVTRMLVLPNPGG